LADPSLSQCLYSTWRSRTLRAKVSRDSGEVQSRTILLAHGADARRRVRYHEPLHEVVEQFPQVAIGSYPNFATQDFRVKLTLESKDAEALDAAMKGLLDRLDQLRIVKAD
jgi:hypothetical protein